MVLSYKKYQSGLSLVEVMIAVVLGLFLLLGLTVIAVNNISTSDELERANQQIENGRYALQLISDDLRNAGYLGEFNPNLLATPAAKPDPCSTTLADLHSALPIAVQGYDRGAAPPSCINDVKANTDIIVIRRASTCAIGDAGCDASVPNAAYFQSSACGSVAELGSTSGNYAASFYALDTVATNLTRHAKDCVTLAPVRQYFTRIYFIANNDKPLDGIPTLKRLELGNPALPGGFTTVSLVQGIDNMQIEYGVDNPTSPTGAPIAFIADPDNYSACSPTTSPTCTAYWKNVVAVKIHLLGRSITPTAGYTTAKTYSMGFDATGSPAIDGPFTDSFKRHLYESTLRINNVAGRNMP